MKIRLTVTAEFEPDPENYDSYPDDVLEQEQKNLDAFGVDEYLNIFSFDELKATLEKVE